MQTNRSDQPRDHRSVSAHRYDPTSRYSIPASRPRLWSRRYGSIDDTAISEGADLLADHQTELRDRASQELTSDTPPVPNAVRPAAGDRLRRLRVSHPGRNAHDLSYPEKMCRGGMFRTSLTCRAPP